MLKDTFLSRVFIRVSIVLLRLIAPLSFAYCITRILLPLIRPGVHIPISKSLLVILDIYATIEVLFFLLVYLPRKWYYNRAAPVFTPLATKRDRQVMFEKVWDATPNPSSYISGWFKGVPVEKLGREDIKDWISWSFWNKTKRDADDEEELEELLAKTETVVGINFKEGRSGHDSMMVTFEPLGMRHRPLLWYVLFVGSADLMMCICLTIYGYDFHTLPISRFLTASFPYRPAALFSRKRSPSRNISYWHIQHTSENPAHSPVLFIHGIGVGLHFYLDFMNEFKRQIHDRYGIGLIALEIMPVCSRITSPILPPTQLSAEIQQILQHHGYTRCLLMTHSYSSVIVAHLLRNPLTKSLVGDLIFVDPVAFSFHPPQVPWNFLRRKPQKASEWQLWYFASMDPDVARVLTRSFVWTENSLWREDVEDRVIGNDQVRREMGRDRWKCTVIIAGRDIITDTNTLGRYLTRQHEEGSGKWYEQTQRGKIQEDVEWKTRKWTGEKAIEVVWNAELNHAEAFDGVEERALMLKVIKNYVLGVDADQRKNTAEYGRMARVKRKHVTGQNSALAQGETTPLLNN